MGNVFKVGDFVGATANYGPPTVKNCKGVIVEIVGGEKISSALIEQKNGIRKIFHRKDLEYTEIEEFKPTYTQLKIGLKIKVRKYLGYNSYYQCDATLINIISDTKNFLFSRAIIEIDDRKEKCSLSEVYPIDFVSKEIC